MNYKFIKIVLLSLLLFGCKNIQQSNIKIEKKYKNSGFALIFNDDLENIKEIEPRSLDIYHNFLKKNQWLK